MAATDRQNRLLLAEDWKRIYQSFRNADFQSYDFDNLRRTMINYLRQNYPEDFNDYIESSEYLALIDLIAFLGQNISFRIDLNARDNFLELAERRESVLRLARLLSYNAKRNQASNGLLKIQSVQTTESVVDSNGFDLSGQTIVWNDPSNSNWNEQFTKVLNASFPVNNLFGQPVKKDVVNGISTQKYKIASRNATLPVFNFRRSVQGVTYPFEVVPADIVDGNIIEESPRLGNPLSILYRNDGAGPSSSNTGFFAHFRQGELESADFAISNPAANEIISIDTPNINNTDVWVYELDSNGAEQTEWTKVDSTEGNNIIYNSLSKNIKNIYSVLTRVDDRANLIFSDGVFGNLPRGRFRSYYRVSANAAIRIKPADMTGVSIKIPYISKNNTKENLTLTFELRYTVSNGATTETNDSIKVNAPTTYYTQNRLITAEDYNIGPLSVSQEIIKVKSVNRTASGISRYFDLLDATGKYSKTNLFGEDGILYKEYVELANKFRFTTQTDIEGIIVNTIEPILKDRKMTNFYYDKFPPILVTDLQASFLQETKDTNRATGKLQDPDGTDYPVGTFTANAFRYIETGALLKFVPPAGYHFMPDGTLMEGPADHKGSLNYKWTKVIGVSNDGTENLATGLGPLVFNDIIPSEAILEQIIPKFTTSLLNDVKTQIIDQAFNYNTFGLRYDVATRVWRLITETNLNLSAEFSTGKTGDISNQQLDASWLVLFQTNGESYDVTSRGLRYVYESDEELKFYYDDSDKIYDSKTGKIIKDRISVLSINTKPDDTAPFTRNFDWEILKAYRDREGYVDSKKVEVGFFDSDDDGVVDDPDIFTEIVQEDVNPNSKFIFQERYLTTDQTEDYRYISSDEVNIITLDSETGIGPYSSYDNGQIFYITLSNVFKKLDTVNEVLTTTNDFRAFKGRSQLQFQYVHAADSNIRIDPSASNIMDVFMLTKGYDTEYRLWLNGARATQPRPPSSDQLFRNYAADINKIKSISDEIIYHPVKYKVLFGPKAEETLQAKFKIVKNPDLVLDDNDIRTRVISAINQFFALENWEFGETFYFTELATYIMNQLAPDVVTVVLVPVQQSQGFGSLFEIKSETDEIFINGSTVDNVEIIDAITATRLNASGTVLTSGSTNSTGLSSSSNGNSY